MRAESEASPTAEKKQRRGAGGAAHPWAWPGEEEVAGQGGAARWAGLGRCAGRCSRAGPRRRLSQDERGRLELGRRRGGGGPRGRSTRARSDPVVSPDPIGIEAGRRWRWETPATGMAGAAAGDARSGSRRRWCSSSGSDRGWSTPGRRQGGVRATGRAAASEGGCRRWRTRRPAMEVARRR